ncbi:MAG: hypothetical protein WCN98_01365 [Verrucomicrobiaceae bacterium]
MPRWNALAVASFVLSAIPFITLALVWSLDLRVNAPEWLVNLLLLLLPAAALVLAYLGVRAANRPGSSTTYKILMGIGLCLGYPSFLFFLLAFPTCESALRSPHIAERSPQAKAINNCKQIITTLKLYNADQREIYPDADLPNAKTSNEVFRRLFMAGVADSEEIFGCPQSELGKPDGNIGTAPDYTEALKPGENHWAMTKGHTDSDSGSIPLIFENPSEATWPPKWNPSLIGTEKPGRPWARGLVIVGFNDGSVQAFPLESTTGTSVSLKPRADGTPIFPTDHKFEVLNAAK